MQPNQPNQPTAPGMPVQPGAMPAPAQPTQPVAPSQSSVMPGGADPLVAGAAAGVPGAGAPVVGMEAQSMAGATPGTMAPEMTAGTTGAPQDMSSLIDAELAKPVENSPMNPTPAMAVEKPKMNPWMIGTIVAAAVALVGIIFGIMMMVQKNNSETSLNKQISTLKGQVTQLQNQLDAVPEVPEVDAAAYIYVGDWGVKLARPMGETQYTYVNTAKTLQLATVGGNINVIQAPTTNAECVETEGGEPCPTYVTTIGNYDYFVRMDGGVTEADRATMFDPASYSSIYETEAANTETTE